MTHELLVVDSLHGLARTEALGPAVDAPAPPTSTEELVARLAAWQATFAAGMADGTVKAVRADWAQYIAWCEQHRRPPLPAPAAQLDAFIRDAVSRGRKRTTVQRYVYTVGLVHKAAGLPIPTDDAQWPALWKAVLKELRARGGLTAKQAGELVQDDIKTILASLGTSPHDLRDAAMLALASDTLMRESELVRVRVEDFAYNRAKGAWTVHVPFSKANQDGQKPDYRYVDAPTRVRLDAWLAAAGIATGYVFLPIGGRPKAPSDDPAALLLPGTAGAAPPPDESPQPLAAKEVARIFRRRALRAGLDHAPTISGHSTRIGTANDLINAGKTTAQIQLAGGWASGAMVHRYTQRSQAGVNAVAELRAERPPAPAPRQPSGLAPPAAEERVVTLWLRLENGSKFTHGKSRARARIESWLTHRWGGVKLAGGVSYRLRLPLADAATQAAVEETLEFIGQEADERNCAAEWSVQDEATGRYWSDYRRDWAD